jgi:hypothetical protein
MFRRNVLSLSSGSNSEPSKQPPTKKYRALIKFIEVSEELTLYVQRQKVRQTSSPQAASNALRFKFTDVSRETQCIQTRCLLALLTLRPWSMFLQNIKKFYQAARYHIIEDFNLNIYFSSSFLYFYREMLSLNIFYAWLFRLLFDSEDEGNTSLRNISKRLRN